MAARWGLREQIGGLLYNGTQGNKVTLPIEDGLGWVPDGAADVGRQLSQDMYIRPGGPPGLSLCHKSTTRICSIMDAMMVAKSKLTWDVPLARSWLDPPTKHDGTSCGGGFHVGRKKPDRGIPDRDILDLDDSRACLIAVRQTWKQANELAQLISQLLGPSKGPSEMNLPDLIGAIRQLTTQPLLDQWLRGEWVNKNPTRSKPISNPSDTQADGVANLLSMYDYTKMFMKFVRIGLETLHSGLNPLKVAVDGYLYTLKSIQASLMAGDAFSADFGLDDMCGAIANIHVVWNDLLKPDVQHCLTYQWPAVEPVTMGWYIFYQHQGGYSGKSALVTPQHTIVAAGINHIELQKPGSMIGLYHVTEGPQSPRLVQRTGVWSGGQGNNRYHDPQTLSAVHLALHESAMSGIQFGKSSFDPNIKNEWQRDESAESDLRREQRRGYEHVHRAYIAFPRHCSTTPTVGVWIMGFETSDQTVNRTPRRGVTTMRVFVESQDQFGFRCVVHLSMSDPGSWTIDRGPFEIGWIAIDGAQQNVELYLNTVRLEGETTGDAGTRVDFGPGTFKVAPTVWCGLKSVRWEVHGDDNIVTVAASRTSSNGTFVKFHTWRDCKIVECEATVLAVGRRLASFDG